MCVKAATAAGGMCKEKGMKCKRTMFKIAGKIHPTLPDIPPATPNQDEVVKS
jgi:hypothetical protein